MPRVAWRIEALNDIGDSIARLDPDAAGRYRSKLRRCGDGLSDFPARTWLANGGRREMTTVPPHALTHNVDETVTIPSIHDGARRPLD